jgi:hypothetical protein
MACYYALLSNPNRLDDPYLKKALRYLKRAIKISPKLCIDLATKDLDFWKIRKTGGFCSLVKDYNPNNQ